MRKRSSFRKAKRSAKRNNPSDSNHRINRKEPAVTRLPVSVLFMIIDIHTHTFPDAIASRTVSSLAHAAHVEPQSDATNAGLYASMAKAGVDYSIVLPVATKPHQVEKINTVAYENNLKFKDKGVISIGAMHPAYENWYEELARIRQLGLKGIKLHPVYQGIDLDDVRTMDILKRCAELGLFAITHAGDDIGFPGVVHCSPDMCLHVCEEIPDLKFVLAHMGGWHLWKEVSEKLANTNAMLDTAFSLHPVHRLDDGHWKENEPWLLSQDEFMDMVQLFGAERIIFGTDCPWADQSEYVQLFESLPLSEDERRKIMGENAAKLLGL